MIRALQMRVNTPHRPICETDRRRAGRERRAGRGARAAWPSVSSGSTASPTTCRWGRTNEASRSASCDMVACECRDAGRGCAGEGPQSPAAAGPAGVPGSRRRREEVKAAGVGLARRRRRSTRPCAPRPRRSGRTLPAPAVGRRTAGAAGADACAWSTPNAAKLVALCSEPRSQLVASRAAVACATPEHAAAVCRQPAVAVRPLAGARVAVRRGPGAACGADAGRRGGPGLAVVLPERGLSCVAEQGVGPEVDRRVAARRGSQPAALRGPGAADAGGPERAARRHARSHRPADGRHPPPARPGPGRPEGPQGRGRRHQVARQDSSRSSRSSNSSKRPAAPAAFIPAVPRRTAGSWAGKGPAT